MAVLPAGPGQIQVVSGVLLVDKPVGPTSHDIVDKLRTFSGIDRIGHGGTLDPMASGLLPLLVGEATKMSGFLQSHDKSYDFDVTLGVATDTHDGEGLVVERRPIPHDLSLDGIEEVLSRFRGHLWQVPPMYSALKKDGVPLYKLARKGSSVERLPREVDIYSLQMTAFDGTILGLKTHCSKGTYIRVLAHEIGSLLGCGGHVSRLRRTSVGGFSVQEATPLSTIQSCWNMQDLENALLGPEKVFEHLPSVRILSRVQSRLVKGGTIPGVWIFRKEGLFQAKDTIRILNQNGQLLGLAHALFDSDNGLGCPVGVPVAKVALLFRPGHLEGANRMGTRLEEGQ